MNTTNNGAAVIGNVLYPVGDVAQATAFYDSVLGLPVKFQDGERFAAVDAGPLSLALAGPAEDVTVGRVAASFKVDDVEAAVARAREAGATVVHEAERGPHEIRAVVLDPWDNPVVVYKRL